MEKSLTSPVNTEGGWVTKLKKVAISGMILARTKLQERSGIIHLE